MIAPARYTRVGFHHLPSEKATLMNTSSFLGLIAVSRGIPKAYNDDTWPWPNEIIHCGMDLGGVYL